MTPNQSKAARVLLDMSIDYVCKNAPVGRRTILEFESGSRKLNRETLSRIKTFYLINGVTIEEEDEFITVKLKRNNVEVEKSPVFSEPVLEYPNYTRIDVLISDIDDVSGRVVNMKLSLPISSELILNYLKSNNISQKEFASQLGCSLAFLNSVVNKKKFLPRKMAVYMDGRSMFPYKMEKIVQNDLVLLKSLSNIEKASIDFRNYLHAIIREF